MLLRSACVLFLAMGALGAQPPSWSLPTKPSVRQLAQRTWRITTLYKTMDLQGGVLGRQRVSALYTRDGERVRWNAAEMAVAGPGEAAFGAPQPRAFMEGFTYAHGDISNQLKAAFFEGFPREAALERNLIWDTHMFEFFGQDWLDRLRLNEAFQIPVGAGSTLDLAGTGTLRQPRIDLTWTGLSKRGGQICAVLDYQVFQCELDLQIPVKLKGRSRYWGQIWISQETGQVEYGTLFEDVLGEMRLPGQANPLMINVFRTAIFEPLGK